MIKDCWDPVGDCKYYLGPDGLTWIAWTEDNRFRYLTNGLEIIYETPKELRSFREIQNPNLRDLLRILEARYSEFPITAYLRGVVDK